MVIGHVLLRGHALNSAADHVESQVLQRFEADATLESPAVCSAIRYGPMSNPGGRYQVSVYTRRPIVCVGVEFNFAAHALTLELRVALNAAAVVSSTT